MPTNSSYEQTLSPQVIRTVFVSHQLCSFATRVRVRVTEDVYQHEPCRTSSAALDPESPQRVGESVSMSHVVPALQLWQKSPLRGLGCHQPHAILRMFISMSQVVPALQLWTQSPLRGLGRVLAWAMQYQLCSFGSRVPSECRPDDEERIQKYQLYPEYHVHAINHMLF